MKKKIIKTIFLILGIWLIFSIYSSVNAASASISANKQTATVGDSVTITTTIKAAAWNLKVSGNGVTATGYADVTDNGENTTITKSINLDTSKSGTYKVSLSGDVTDGSTGATTAVNTSTTITINEKVVTPAPTPAPTPTVTKSSDATLKSITIGGKTYSGTALNSTITHTVDSSVGSIKISAVQNNNKASISGTGTKSLIAGQTNKFTIKVTAENGATKNYNVNVIRLAEVQDTPNVIEENQQEEILESLKLTSLVIKDVELNTEFNPDVLSYIANVKNMHQLEIDATANREGAEIKIEGADELKNGDNKILIIATLGEEKIQYTVEVYNKIDELEPIVGSIQENGPTNTAKTTFEEIKDVFIDNWRLFAIMLLIIILAIIGIRSSILVYKYSKKIKILTGEMSLAEEHEGLNIEKEEIEQDDNIKESKNRKIGKHF